MQKCKILKNAAKRKWKSMSNESGTTTSIAVLMGNRRNQTTKSSVQISLHGALSIVVRGSECPNWSLGDYSSSSSSQSNPKRRDDGSFVPPSSTPP